MKNKRIAGIVFLLLSTVILVGLTISKDYGSKEALKVSNNGRFLITDGGKPFFWLGDTGWKLFLKLSREDAELYLEDRREKGFNVIQVMISFYNLSATNFYGDSIFVNGKVDQPKITEGNSFNDKEQYDYWDHVDYIIKLAQKKGIYMGIVPVWGTSVRAGWVDRDQAYRYAAFLANRYRDFSNIIWLNGGDLRGSDSTAIWEILGKTLDQKDPNHLITFHPYGQTSSATWFHDSEWLDFDMFQSGHSRYDQNAGGYAQDNWRFIKDSYYKKPIKPILDGESAYEGIPQGLDNTQDRWEAMDIRRNAYWSVFNGAFGFTYGANSVWQMYSDSDDFYEYNPDMSWKEALNLEGATQLIYLKELMLSKSYLTSKPDTTLLIDQGNRYDYIPALEGNDFAFFYTFNGRSFSIDVKNLGFNGINAVWFNPRDGTKRKIKEDFSMSKITFDPPGTKKDGNDWVLILEKT